MSKYDEVEVIQRAYDELKALDPAGCMRALEWLHARFVSEHEQAKKAREQAARERITQRR